MKRVLFVPFLFLSLYGLHAQNSPPVGVNDTIYGRHGFNHSVNVLRNDYDPDGDSIMFWDYGPGGMIEVSDSVLMFPYREDVSFLKKTFQSNIYRIQDEHGNWGLESWARIYLGYTNPLFDSLSINNINARFWACASMFDRLEDSDGDYRFFETPKGSNLSTMSNFRLLMAGKDENDKIHSVYEWESLGEFLIPGPYANNYDSLYRLRWFDIWKISKAEIDFHRSHWSEGGYEASEAITTWPGSGDPENGESLKIAPYVDYNNNGFYDPLQGDYPLINGDQAIFFVKHEFVNQERDYGFTPMGIELKGLAYAFDCPEDSALNNTIFLRYQITNTSDTNYHDVFCGFRSDFQLGYAWDNYSGCDTVLDSWFVYNGKEEDLHNDVGYGLHPPAQGIVLLNKNLDHYIIDWDNYVSNDQDAWLRLQAYWDEDQHLTYGGKGFFGSQPVNHIFPDNPLDTLSGWTELTAATIPSRRAGWGSFGPLEFNKGDVITIDLAFPVARDYQGNNLTSVKLLKERIEKLKYYYDNDTLPCGGSFAGKPENLFSDLQLSVFPNPASNMLFIQSKHKQSNSKYSLFDTYGCILSRGMLQGDFQQIDISDLSPGFYLLHLRNGTKTKSFKIIKQ